MGLQVPDFLVAIEDESVVPPASTPGEPTLTPSANGVMDPNAASPAANDGGDADDADRRFRGVLEALREERGKRAEADARASRSEEKLSQIQPEYERYLTAKPAIQAIYNQRLQAEQVVQSLQTRLALYQEEAAKARAAGYEIPPDEEIGRREELNSALASLSNIRNDIKAQVAETLQEHQANQAAESRRIADEAAKRAQDDTLRKSFDTEWASISKDHPELEPLRDLALEKYTGSGGVSKPSVLFAPVVARATREAVIDSKAEQAKAVVRTQPAGGTTRGASPQLPQVPANVRGFEVFDWLRRNGHLPERSS